MWAIKKKRPKKSWASNINQTNEFVGKNNKKTASGGATVGWPLGPLGGSGDPLVAPAGTNNPTL
jgi:hypothetical protein